jgi:formylglycine-generating enzyme required for sulfatase activity
VAGRRKAFACQDFDLEIYKAARDSDSIIICLSKVSVTKEGYVNKEIRRALEAADEKPEGAIYIIPLRLDDCSPSFERLKKLHWADYFTPNAHEKLLKALRVRASMLKIETFESEVESVIQSKPVMLEDDGLDLYRFIEIPPQKDSKVPYPFAIGKYPVTNAQYKRFANAPDFANPVYWVEFPKFDENCEQSGDWGKQGLDWLQEQLKKAKSKVLLPRYWKEDFGIINPTLPVVGISWYEASAYCEWLFQNWHVLPESKANPFLKPKAIRLPLEIEWVIAAGGDNPDGSFPWDEAGKSTRSLKEILRRANIDMSGIGHTTPVNNYTLGKSIFGIMDLAGNVFEWQVNFWDIDHDHRSLRGGSWSGGEDEACVWAHYGVAAPPINRTKVVGFRVVVTLSSG